MIMKYIKHDDHNETENYVEPCKNARFKGDQKISGIKKISIINNGDIVDEKNHIKNLFRLKLVKTSKKC